MHVLQILPALEIGGVERGVLDLTKGLIARGHRVSVISSGGSLVERLIQLGATHHQLPVGEKSLRTIRDGIPRVAQIIQATQVDIVHARSRVPGWIGYGAARLTQRPFVTTAHGFYRPHLASRVMTWGRLVIAPSEALGCYLMEEFQLPRERLRIIPRGVDLEEFPFQPPTTSPDTPWRLGLFGRLSPLKGQEIALRACERLIRSGTPVTLCIAGDVPGSPARHALEQLIRTLKLEASVEWLGVRQDMPALIASVDMVLVPSTYPESFGRSVVEAQAVGRPVIASRLGAFPEIIEHGVNGLLVPPGDPNALADAIARFIDDASLREACIRHGRERVETHWSAARMTEQTLAVYEECLTQPRILIWKLSALGDVILSTPSLRAIRRQYPQARITLVVGRGAYEVVARCPYLNDIIVYDRAGKDRGLRGHFNFVRRLRRSRFDLSVDLQNSRKTHLMAWCAGISIRAGYRRKYGWLLNRGVRLPRVVLTPIAHQRYLLKHAGFSMDDERLELWPSTEDENRARALLGITPSSARSPLIGMHPGGSGRWVTKRWDLDRWARLCDMLTQQGVHVVVVGGPEERALGEALTQLTRTPPRMIIGQTSVMELACVIKQCDVFIAHDSSSLHVATAVGTPAVALFGPTDPRRHLPSTFTGQVIKQPVFCSPCYSTRCRTITHACMKRISVEQVLSVALGVLAEQEHRSA